MRFLSYYIRKEDRLYKKNKNSPASLGCGMNYKIRVTSVVGGETVSPTDMKLIPAGRNTGIQPLHKGYRLWIKTKFWFIKKTEGILLSYVAILLVFQFFHLLLSENAVQRLFYWHLKIPLLIVYDMSLMLLEK